MRYLYKTGGKKLNHRIIIIIKWKIAGGRGMVIVISVDGGSMRKILTIITI